MNEYVGSRGTPAPRFVPVCAIGASAGGVTALQGLFRQLPNNLGLAYVVVLHLSPDQPSALSDILAGCTRMPVFEIKDGPTLKRDCVYVIPPDRELVIEGDSVTARPFSEPRGRRAPIDMFFRSIAAARGDGIAVVLSGAGADGTLGVQAVKEAGGVIMVQEPAEAAFPSMPQNAIASGVADFVAPLARLAERLAEVAQSKEAVRSLDMEGSANDLRRIVAFLRARTGHDFSSYKRATVMRRVVRRMQVCRTATVAAYADYLAAAPEEAKELFADLLISVTMFFRDPRAFEALQRHAIKPIFDDLDPEKEESVRAWVVGCATGEEAYSLAMLLHEEADRRKVRAQFQIFASDLDEGALATAREGRYPRSIETDVSDERLARFFVDEGTHYRVRKELRESVLFATHSVLKEPPFMRLDIISCRNLLIYMERALQQQICSIFHYGLKPGRFLFLGSAETADSAANLFAPLDRDARIYGARPQASHALPILPQFSAPERLNGHNQPVIGRNERGDLPVSLHASALERVAPASVLVDSGHNIVHLSPSAGRFILHSAGPVSNQLPAIVRPELRLDLRLALTRAFDANEPMLTHPTLVTLDGVLRRVSMHVAPVPNGLHMGAQALVLFLDSGSAPDDAEVEATSDYRPDEVRRLHAELKAAQEAVVASRAGHEASIQDLRATNEELQSINEEYRSTAEELETSKEELQSINEELHTVNAELKSKLSSISVAHSDLQNLTDATEVGTLFLDADLHIKMFTPPIADLFNVTKADIGRTITDFSHHLDYNGMVSDARHVLRQLTPVERMVHSRHERSYVLRMRPYRTIEDRIDGVVVTLFDITARQQAEAALADELRIMTQLHALGDRLLSITDLASGLSEVLNAALAIYGVNRGTIQILDPDSDALRYAASIGFDPNALANIPPIDRDFHSTCAVSIRTGERIVASDIPGDVRWADHAPTAALLGYKAAISLPIKTRQAKLLGVLTIHFSEPYTPSDRELRWVDLFAQTAAHLVDRARTEADLKESEERFQQFADASAAGLWIRDASSLLMEFVSPAIAAIYGVEADFFLGDVKHWASMIVPEDREAALQHLAEARGGKTVMHEFRIRRPSDGAFRWIRNTDFPLRDNGLIPRIGGITEDVTEAKLAAEHQGVLLAELQHRVRNTMAIVRSIAARTGERAESVTEYGELMLGRLLALARVQALLTRGANVSVGIRNIVRDEIAVQAPHEDQYLIDGPDVALSPKAGEVLTLAVHELATNAVKYGAFSVPQGKVTVRWNTVQRNGHTWLVFNWMEEGAPISAEALQAKLRRRGFGSELIEGRVPYELRGRGTVSIEPGGAKCHLEFPLDDGASILETDAPARVTVFGGALDMTGEANLRGKCILVVEDDYYLAMDAMRALQGAGAEVLGPCPTDEAARSEIAGRRPDAALVDINLGSGPAFKLAGHVKDCGIPFVFVTGYDPNVIPAEFDGIERLEKPVQLRDLVGALARILSD